MNNDTALILLLADLQRQIETLKTENTALSERLAQQAVQQQADA